MPRRTAPRFWQAGRVLHHVGLGKGTNLVAHVLFQLGGLGIVKDDASTANDKSVDPLALDGVRDGHNGSLDNIRVLRNRTFQFGGADAVAGDLNERETCQRENVGERIGE